MKLDAFRFAQSEIAQQMSNSAIAEDSKKSKLDNIINSGRSAMLYVAVVAAAVVGSGLMAQNANAQDYTRETIREMAAQQRAYERQQQAEQRAYERQQQSAQRAAERDARAMDRQVGGAVGNLAASLGKDNGLNNPEARQLSRMANTGYNVARGNDGNNLGQRVGIGSAVGGLLGAISSSKENKVVAGAVGALLGAGAGVVWDSVSNSNSQPQRPVQHQNVTYQDQPNVQVQQNQQRPVRVFDPSAMNMPDLIIKVADKHNIGFVEPGSIPLPSNRAEWNSEGPAKNLGAWVSSMGAMKSAFKQRSELLDFVETSRSSPNGNQLDQGRVANELLNVQTVIESHLKKAIVSINAAAMHGGYDTKMMIDMTAKAVNEGYRPDVKVSYAPNSNYKYAPQ